MDWNTGVSTCAGSRDQDPPEYRYSLGSLHGDLGAIFQKQGKLAESRVAYRTAADVLEALVKDYSKSQEAKIAKEKLKKPAPAKKKGK